MVIRHHGQPHGVRVAWPYLVALAVFVLAFFCVSLLVFYRYASLSRERDELAEKNAVLNQEVTRYRQQVQTAKQYQALIEQLNNKDRASAAPPATEPEKEKTPPPLPETPNAPLTVSELSLAPDRRGNSLSFSFRLATANRPNKPVAGTLVVLFRRLDGGEPKEVLFPASIKMTDGRPSNPEQGFRFSLKRYITIRGRVADATEPNRYTEVTVLAYADNGELLMNAGLATGTKTGAP